MHDKTNKMICAPSEDPDESDHYGHEEALGPWLFLERTVKILIRLGECPDCSESSLGVWIILFVYFFVVLRLNYQVTNYLFLKLLQIVCLR